MSNLHGCFTAMITPFKNGAVDDGALQDFVEWQVEQGVQGIVPCGTTGESPTLTPQEHMRVIELAVEAAAGRITVMAGTGSNATQEAVEFTEHAAKAGADAVLVVMPYYNKPTIEGQKAHFTAVADAVDIPNIVYNIPGRSVVDMSDETLAELAKHPNIAGVKDATGDLARVASLRALVDDEFAILSGEDVTAVGFNAMGGHGVISVTSNIMPAAVAEVQKHCRDGNFADATAVQDKLIALHQAMFCETNPIPVKYAAHLLGKCSDEVRLPLTLPSMPHQEQIKAAMQAHNLI